MLQNKLRQISIVSIVLCMILLMLSMNVFAAENDQNTVLSNNDACTHAETYTSTTESTCIKNGVKQTICKTCDEVISEEELPLSEEHVFHKGACLLCKIPEPVSCEHDYETIKENKPTCKEAGYVWTKCTKCGDEKNYEVGEPTSEHSGGTYLDIYESTCVKNGYEKTRCKTCNEVLSEKELPLSNEHVYRDDKCLLCGAGAPCEHEYETVKELAPTCKEAGYVWTKCTKCGNEKNYEVGEPTSEHSGGTYLDIYESTCVKNGYEKTRCKTCDEVLSEKELPLSNEHVYRDDKCLLCGAEAACKHEYETVKELAPTCKEAGYVWTKCTKCGNEKNYEVGEPTSEHTYDNACDADCNVCNNTREVDGHTYDDEYDSDCNKCGTKREVTETPDEPTEPSEPEQPTEPSEPEQPTEPSEPEQPTEPSEPDEPTEPSEPEQPTEPSEPDEPTEPSEPEQPTEPEATETTDDNKADDDNKTDEIPKTGDSSLILLVTLMIASAIGVVLIVKKRQF